MANQSSDILAHCVFGLYIHRTTITKSQRRSIMQTSVIKRIFSLILAFALFLSAIPVPENCSVSICGYQLRPEISTKYLLEVKMGIEVNSEKRQDPVYGILPFAINNERNRVKAMLLHTVSLYTDGI